MKQLITLSLCLLLLSANSFIHGAESQHVEGTPYMTASYSEMFFRRANNPINLYVSGYYITQPITYQLEGADAQYFEIDEIDDNSYLWLSITFNPDGDQRAHNASIRFSSEGAEDLIVDLIGIIPALSMGLINFGEVEVNTTSPGVKLYTLGIDTLDETALPIYSSNETQAFSITDRHYDPETYKGYVAIVFSPTQLTNYYGRISYSSINILEECSLQGVGVTEGAPYLYAEDDVIDFPYVARNETITKYTFLIAHDLIDEVTFKLLGPDAPFFTVVEADNFDPVDNLMYKISFTPTALGTYNTQLVFSSTGATDQVIDITGMCSPVINVNPESIDFGDVPLYTTSAEYSITVSGIDIDGGITYDITWGDDVFNIDDTAWNPETGGELKVTFTPNAVLSEYSNIQFKSNNALTKYVNLSGRGVENPNEPIITVTPDILYYVNPYVGVTSEKQQVEISGTNLAGDITYEIEGNFGLLYTIEEVSWDPATGGILAIDFTPSKDVYMGPAEGDAYITFRSPYAIEKRLILDGTNVSIITEDIMFETTEVGTASPPQTIIVSGLDLYNGPNLTKLWNDDDAFAIEFTSFDPETVMSTVDITFTPKEERSYEGGFQLAGIGDGKSLLIGVMGVGTKSPTALTSVDNKIFAQAENDRLIVYNLHEGSAVKVLDINGRVIATGDSSAGQYAAALSSKGIYFVKITGVDSKVLKVLNH